MQTARMRKRASQCLVSAATVCLLFLAAAAEAARWSHGDALNSNGQELSVSNTIRQLLQDEENTPVYVSQPRELEDAILKGRRHIVITAHLDMTSMPLRSTSICSDGCESPLPEVRETWSIRGECVAPPTDIDVAVLNQTPGAAELLPFRDKQCLVMTHEDLFPILSYRIWLDNLYLRAVYHNAERDREYQFISMAGFPPLKWPLAGQGKRWITRSTFQGDGLGPAVGLWIDENAYIENCTFANLGGDASPEAACADCTGNVNAAGAPVRIVNSTFFDPVPMNYTNYLRAWGNGSFYLTGCVFGELANATQPLFYTKDNGEIFSDDASIRVRTDTGPPIGVSLVKDVPTFANISANRNYLTRTDEWFVDIVATLNDTVDPRPAYPAPLEPVPRIEVDPDANAFDPTLNEPADINASPPRAPNDDDDLSAGVIVAIVLAIVILLLICLALCCLLLLRRRRRQQQQDMVVKDASAAGGNNGSQTNATATGGAISSLPWDKASLRSDGALSGAGSALAPQPSHATSTNSGQRGSMHNGLPTASSVDTSHAGSVPAMPVPPAGAPLATLVAFIQSQLDTIGPHDIVLSQFKLQGSSASDRCIGGRSVVAFATGSYDRLPYALKFFASRAAFDAEVALRGRDTIGKLAPRIAAMHDPAIADGTTPGATDRFGRPLPPCIATARGESLTEWTQRASPDVFQAVAVLAHVANHLRDIHAAGYVHRDVKPAHILLLPRENRWTIIDFDRAAAIGTAARPAATLEYAPPEVFAAMSSGGRPVEAHPALDAWALGVVAFELLTGNKALDTARDGPEAVAAQLRGDAELPWEGVRLCQQTRFRLGIFCKAVLGLLERDPARRCRMADFCDTCNDIVMTNTTAGA